ncbi:ribosome silencing factor [Anoxybacter fermentans]|uniref:ribosome silencing factor n=1 Tax=Anoxybacter fermentans TaxID=1323375 RepID=UPI001F01F491|nr:ribosome silencing factor [Anoxybacter fermentans]
MAGKEIKTLVQLACQAADDKKAQDIVTLDISKISLIADYFIICSGKTDIQVKAIAQEIEHRLEEKGIRPRRIEGRNEGVWILMDYGDFIVHVFRQQEREYYNLERLWADAQEIVTQ